MSRNFKQISKKYFYQLGGLSNPDCFRMSTTKTSWVYYMYILIVIALFSGCCYTPDKIIIRPWIMWPVSVHDTVYVSIVAKDSMDLEEKMYIIQSKNLYEQIRVQYENH